MQVASKDRYGLLYQRVFPGALAYQFPQPQCSFLVKQIKNKCITGRKLVNTASLDCLQNQILTKGLSIILDEIQKHEGETQDVVNLLFVSIIITGL